MGGILGGGSSGTQTPVYTGIQIQTSAQGLPIPILWGANRISANLIDYFNFYKQDAGKGKGGKSGQYDYFAAVILALCEGATLGYTTTIGEVWQDLSETTLSALGFGLFPGTGNQAPWNSAVAAGHGVAYSFTAYLANGNLALGSSATLPNHNFEVFSTLRSLDVGLEEDGTRLPDANLGHVIPDFVTNTRYGLNMDPSLLQGFDDLVTYHFASNLSYSPFLKDQEQVQTILQRWSVIGNFWIFWSGTALVAHPLGDTIITGNDVTFTPNVTPIYDLGPDDFQVSDKNSNKADPPVKVTRKDPADGFNQVQLDCNIRANKYQDTPFRWQDDTSVDQVGVQAPNIISASEICNGITAAQVVSLVGKRQLYIRNDYEFKLLPTFILLLPGDVVTLTEPNVGLNLFPVKIKQVEEDDKGYLSFTAEEFVQGVGTASISEFEPWGGSAPFNTNVDPGPVNTPAFYAPQSSQTQGINELWVALSGGQWWGGCGIFLSFDDMNYTQIGVQPTKSLQGVLTAALPLASGLDITNTLSIDLTESQTVIPTGATEADAQAFRTLVMIDNELIAYGSVLPTGSYTANLTYLERGVYGTTPAAHTIGAPFSRIDQTAVFSYALPLNYVGTPLYFKFPSVNIFESQPQTLAECLAYEYTPSNLAPVGGLYAVYNYNTGGVLQNVTVSWTPPSGQEPSNYTIRWSNLPSGTMGQTYNTQNVSAPASQFIIPAADIGPGFQYISMQTTQGTVSSPWTADFYLAVPAVGTAVESFNMADGSYAGMQVTWTPVSSAPFPVGYQIWLGDSASDMLVHDYTPGNSGSLFVPASLVQSQFPSWSGSAGATYNWDVSVQAVYPNGLYSLLDAPLAGMSTPPQPSLVASVTATAGGSAGVVNVSWPAVTGTYKATSYTVFYWHGTSGGGGFTFGSINVPAPLTSAQLTGLTSGFLYNVAIASYNVNGTAMTFDIHGIPTGTPITTVTAP